MKSSVLYVTKYINHEGFAWRGFYLYIFAEIDKHFLYMLDQIAEINKQNAICANEYDQMPNYIN